MFLQTFRWPRSRQSMRWQSVEQYAVVSHPLQGRASFFPQIVHMLSASFVRVFRASYSRFFLINSGSMISDRARRSSGSSADRKGKIAQNLTPRPKPTPSIALMSLSMPASAAASSLRQAGFALENAKHQPAKVGAERN